MLFLISQLTDEKSKLITYNDRFLMQNEIPIIVDVKPTNKIAIKAYQKAGFKIGHKEGDKLAMIKEVG